MDQNEKCLLSIRDEMEKKELYIKSYIDKEPTRKKQERFLKWLQVMVLEKKTLIK